MSGQGVVVYVFDTTHHALWAEEVARRLALGAQVVPAPAEAKANCDLALEVLAEDAATLEKELRERGVQFAIA